MVCDLFQTKCRNPRRSDRINKMNRIGGPLYESQKSILFILFILSRLRFEYPEDLTELTKLTEFSDHRSRLQINMNSQKLRNKKQGKKSTRNNVPCFS